MKSFKAVIFFLLIQTLIWIPAQALADEKPIGKLIGISGAVEFRSVSNRKSIPRNDGTRAIRVSYTPWQKAAFKQPIYKSDILHTSKRSRLKILFLDNSLIALGPNSTLEVKKYFLNKNKKLRQAVLNVASGLAMYIINKNQKNEKSNFKMVTPTAIIASRGTHGYISSYEGESVVANQAGVVLVQNINPNIPGQVSLGPQKASVISANQPPRPPTNLTPANLSVIRNGILGKVEPKIDKSKSSLINFESADIVDSESSQTADASTATSVIDGSLSRNFGPGFENTFFKEPDLGTGFGGPEDFASINDPFNPNTLTSCGP
jgi:hypothetical protein